MLILKKHPIALGWKQLIHELTLIITLPLEGILEKCVLLLHMNKKNTALHEKDHCDHTKVIGSIPDLCIHVPGVLEENSQKELLSAVSKCICNLYKIKFSLLVPPELTSPQHVSLCMHACV